MPAACRHLARVDEDGRINDLVRRQVAADIARFRGRDVEITISPPKRSSRANSYYWGHVLKQIRIAADESGQHVTQEALHGYYKQKYADPIVVQVGNRQIIEYSTRNMTSTEFFEYVERVKTDEIPLSLGVVFDAME